MKTVKGKKSVTAISFTHPNKEKRKEEKGEEKGPFQSPRAPRE